MLGEKYTVLGTLYAILGQHGIILKLCSRNVE
jgi:hypothetical protein